MVSKNENFGNFPSNTLKSAPNNEHSSAREVQPKVSPAAGADSSAYQGHSSYNSDIRKTSSETPVSTASTASTAPASDISTSEVKAKAEELSRELKAKTEQLRGEAETKAAQAQEEGKRLVNEARERGMAEVEGGKRLVADEVGGFANALQATANQLESQQQLRSAHYVHQAASGLEQISRNLREQDLSNLVSRVQDFARRQPELFLGGAVAGGFLLARFLKSSAARRHAPSSYDSAFDRPATGYTSRTAYDPAPATDETLQESAANPNSAFNANTSAVGVPEPKNR